VRHFDNQLIILASREMRIKLVAIAYQQGQKGMYSRPSKTFIQDGIKNYLDGLTPKQKEEFQEILSNVNLLADQGKIPGVMTAEEYAEFMKKRKRKRKGEPRLV
jgi:uncharacterized protein with von Willebrand factor type A (vWA) domain